MKILLAFLLSLYSSVSYSSSYKNDIIEGRNKLDKDILLRYGRLNYNNSYYSHSKITYMYKNKDNIFYRINLYFGETNKDCQLIISYNILNKQINWKSELEELNSSNCH